jgi:hypothetical protein
MDWKPQMPPCQASTFTPDRVNITIQPERITFEPTEIANVPAETQARNYLVDEVINRPSIVTNDTRPGKTSMTWLEAKRHRVKVR